MVIDEVEKFHPSTHSVDNVTMTNLVSVLFKDSA